MATLPITISVTSDLISAEGSAGAAFAGQLYPSGPSTYTYTPTYGPSAGTAINPNDSIYLWSGTVSDNVEYDYALASSVVGGSPAADDRDHGRLRNAAVTTGNQVIINWGATGSQPQSADILSYNVYRGTAAAGVPSWTLIDSPTITSSTSSTDTGQSGSAATPVLNPLANYFDPAIEGFFDYYDAAAGNTLELTVQTGGYQTNHSWVFSFSGTTLQDPVTSLQCLQLTLTAIWDATAQTSVPAANWPFPQGTPFNIYYPYWNTNTFGTATSGRGRASRRARTALRRLS